MHDFDQLRDHCHLTRRYFLQLGSLAAAAWNASPLAAVIRCLLGSRRTRRPNLPRTRVVGCRGAHQFRSGRPGLARIPRASAASDRRIPGQETVITRERGPLNDDGDLSLNKQTRRNSRGRIKPRSTAAPTKDQMNPTLTLLTALLLAPQAASIRCLSKAMWCWRIAISAVGSTSL
jgi:hypothetical protein